MNLKIKTADRDWAESVFEKINAKLKAECGRMGNTIPYIPRNGRYHDLDTSDGIYWWTNGFWPGMLWQMYHAAKDDVYRKTAESAEQRLDEALEGFEGLYHDVGFMWLHTAAANYRLTGNAVSRRRALHAANILAGRYNPAGKFIRAWNGEDRAGWVIIDTLMNLPLLYWAAGETKDPRYSHIAKYHADTAMDVIVRPDGSCNHIAVLSPETGECLSIPEGQGYAPDSSWSRGQSWAVYGYALSFRCSGQVKYLDTAKRTAHYCVSNFALNDWLPLVDFRSPPQPRKFDSTAGMICACGLLEIANHAGEHEQPFYYDSAVNILKACEKAFANWNCETDGLIDKGTVAYHSGPEGSEVPIIYGDYFFTEAILRLLEKDFLIW